MCTVMHSHAGRRRLSFFAFCHGKDTSRLRSGLKRGDISYLKKLQASAATLCLGMIGQMHSYKKG
jgi:hypothetical protein